MLHKQNNRNKKNDRVYLYNIVFHEKFSSSHSHPIVVLAKYSISIRHIYINFAKQTSKKVFCKGPFWISKDGLCEQYSNNRAVWRQKCGCSALLGHQKPIHITCRHNGFANDFPSLWDGTLASAGGYRPLHLCIIRHLPISNYLCFVVWCLSSL